MTSSKVLIDALEYIKKFKGDIFVVKLGGELQVAFGKAPLKESCCDLTHRLMSADRQAFEHPTDQPEQPVPCRPEVEEGSARHRRPPKMVHPAKKRRCGFWIA